MKKFTLTIDMGPTGVQSSQEVGLHLQKIAARLMNGQNVIGRIYDAHTKSWVGEVDFEHSAVVNLEEVNPWYDSCN